MEKNPEQLDSNPFRYCGEYTDLETNTLYLRNRHYNPAVGRFTSEDVARAGLNWYTYCGNNPIAFADPLGLERVVVSGGVYKKSKQESGSFYYEFIEPAIKQLNTCMENAGEEKVTWIIADAGWTDLDKDNFRRAMETNFSGGVGIKYISSSDDLIDYINNVDGGDRSADKITNMSVFSHGAQDKLMLGFDYSSSKSTFRFYKRPNSKCRC